MECKTLHFFSPVQTGLPREQAKSLTRASQPGLVSPGGGEKAQRSNGTNLLSLSPGEPLISLSGESLRHMVSNLVSMVMRSPCAGDALDHPLWKVPKKALSLSLSLSFCLSSLALLHLIISQTNTRAASLISASVVCHETWL